MTGHSCSPTLDHSYTACPGIDGMDGTNSKNSISQQSVTSILSDNATNLSGRTSVVPGEQARSKSGLCIRAGIHEHW